MSDAQKCTRFEYNERTVAVTEARCEILDLLSQGLDAKVEPDHCRNRSGNGKKMGYSLHRLGLS